MSYMVALATHFARTERDPLGALQTWLDSLTDLEVIQARYDWSLWARPEQVFPDTDWLSFGFLGGRGMGKTRPCAEYVVQSVTQGTARRIAILAQNEPRAWEVMVEGESGILSCSPPWMRPEVSEHQLTWANGAIATIYTPEAPDALFGPQHDLVWCSEIHAWPKTQGLKAFNAVRMGNRLGRAQFIWDSNPKPRDPILLSLLAKSRKRPEAHIIVRGGTDDNAMNLNAKQLQDWHDEFDGTTTGRVMLGGDMLENVDGALWNEGKIERVAEAPILTRIAIGVDPATTAHEGSDASGIIVVGLGADGFLYVLEDLSGVHPWETWGELVVDRYLELRAAVVSVERNKGGDACASNIRGAARMRTIRGLPTGDVVVVQDGRPTRWEPGTIWVREVYSADDKASRALPIVGEYERHRIRHVGRGLGDLEEEMCSWDGTGKSPNRIDALVFACSELLALGATRPPPRSQDVGAAVELLAKATGTPRGHSRGIVGRFGGFGGGRI